MSKVRILQRALDYIHNLKEMIAEVDGVSAYQEEENNIARKDDSLLFDF